METRLYEVIQNQGNNINKYNHVKLLNDIFSTIVPKPLKLYIVVYFYDFFQSYDVIPIY